MTPKIKPLGPGWSLTLGHIQPYRVLHGEPIPGSEGCIDLVLHLTDDERRELAKLLRTPNRSEET